ncbi:hypothetical protein GOP47_0002505 [Adiantum capillus-veneris]|uniref:Uncharacterized protein n=1 Tax=Adiantum capillus-veneris TaxID=13818 RepID=A0A9D4ZRB3_ADICA|nr:hypothetical protein GOP47_0002505 [Adiantum capillus-veneris]
MLAPRKRKMDERIQHQRQGRGRGVATLKGCWEASLQKALSKLALIKQSPVQESGKWKRRGGAYVEGEGAAYL